LFAPVVAQNFPWFAASGSGKKPVLGYGALGTAERLDEVLKKTSIHGIVREVFQKTARYVGL